MFVTPFPELGGKHRARSARSTMKSIAAPDFDLEKTLDSGQVFHWQKIGSAFYGTIGDLPVSVAQSGSRLQFTGSRSNLDGLKRSRSRTAAPMKLAKVVARYFALDHPLGEICAAFPKDEALDAAGKFCSGLRIIRQPKWECLATFICSSMKQVAHIRQMSHALRERFGARHEVDGQVVYTFPSAERIAHGSEKELRTCGLGYRAKNLLATARLVANGTASLEAWSDLPDDALRAELCALPGVGPKVANCVMLFAYERLRAFPIDVWIERVLRQRYFPRKRKVTPQQLRAFCESYFGEHGGYAQQYLFHHARKGGGAGPRTSNRSR
jgi:N-glycosylase/DNA lyase